MTEEPRHPERIDHRAERIRRRRSIAIGLALGFMVIAFYIATFVRLGGNVVNGMG
ncbi:protein CoxF [Hyphomicrobium sp.]|uniref:protein CoxF n=1 Tax=Hyphomicrobium sp. TaxID=82 RepID=UPI000FA47DAE|nr:protein CoxF [Hyphomicrobium sp.]RUO97318.1 MAG: protein CoxF [Hyphomicrobium sp.]